STVLRRNASTNPALSVDDAGWHGDDGTGAAGARAAVSGFDRAYGFTVTAAADTVKINTGTVVLGQKQTWTLSASVSCSAADSLYVYAHFNDADGTYLGWVRNSSITVAADTVTRVAITAVAPTGAASGYLQAYFKDTAVGDVASMTMFLAEQADAAGEYFDGASSGASWEGTAGASASTLTGSALGLSFPLDFGSSGAANVMYLPNAGTADVLPLFTFASPVDQPVLTNLDNGARLEYLNSVGAGQTLTIDCKTKRVLLNGVSRRVDMGRADFDAFAVPANGVLRVAFGTLMYAISGAHVDATYRPGWW
ncbi:MAG: phage distal tail protein, partial [Streptosporangiales bacterium]